MAENTKSTYPLMPISHWWALRNKFKQSIPSVVTANYVASVLDMNTQSARNNILPTLRQVGIIDQEGKTTDRAKRWRDDEQYPKVCAEIRKATYPQELLEAIPDTTSGRGAAERWFANHTGAGQVAVRKMTSFYLLLCEADPQKKDEKAVTSGKSTKGKTVAKRVQSTSNAKIEHKAVHSATPAIASNVSAVDSIPSVNINIQIHISADATTNQIEQIFQSMAKHIYNRG